MVILHVIDITNPKGNGVATAVKEYIKYEKEICDVGVYNLNYVVDEKLDVSFSKKDYDCISELPMPFNKPDLVIFNEVYKPSFIKLYKECLKNSIKYVIIPHGCLVEDSQKKHRFKKIIGNILLFNRFIRCASAIQFLNESEMKNSKFKYKKSIIAGNGVDKPKYKNNGYNNKDLIYIGRYEIKHKGLDLLIKICKENRKWFIDNNVRIQLYGRDSGNELKKFQKMISINNVGDILIVNGPVYDDDKKQVLKNSYAFIQTSRFEGQPMGIIEALSVGVPCIVTYGTYLGDFIENSFSGISCNFDSKELFKAIKYLINNPKIRDKMSENSYKKTNNIFYWKNVICSTIDKYRKI